MLNDNNIRCFRHFLLQSKERCWVYLLRCVYLFQSVDCRWGLTCYGVFTFFSLLNADGVFLVKECLPFLVCWLPLDVYLLWSVYLFQSVDCRWGFTCYEVLTFSVCWLPLGVYLLWSVYFFHFVDCRWGFTSYGVLTFFSLLTAAGSLAIPAVPSASVISVLIVLSSLDIQVHNIGIVFAVEWYK